MQYSVVKSLVYMIIVLNLLGYYLLRLHELVVTNLASKIC